MSLRLILLNGVLRLVAKPRLARQTDPEKMRRDMDRAARWIFRAPPFSLWLDGSIAGPAGRLPVLHVSNGPVDRSRVILYLHGGAYVAGSPFTHRKMLARLSRLAGVPVMAPDYRLAPEHPFPAAIEDARAAWDHLYAVGYDPEDIVIGGDSAGGGLALALLAQLCAEGTAPALSFAFSPWTDLTGQGASAIGNRKADPLLPGERLPDAAASYFGGAEPAPTDPRASPLFAAFRSPPPVLLQCSTSEILRDDSRRMAEVLRDAGSRVTLTEWTDAPHVWQIFDGWIPEARAALIEAAEAVRRALNPRSPPPAGS